MVEFADDFDRTPGDLEGNNGWGVVGSNDLKNGVLEIRDRYVTNTAAAVAGIASQNNAGTQPTTRDQRVTAFVSSSEEDSSTYVRIGIGGQSSVGGGTFAERARMAFIELQYRPNGERILSLITKVEGATVETTLASIVMVASGGIPQAGYYGGLLDGGALNTLQELRLIVTQEEYGLKLQGYANNLDDDKPTIEGQLRSDFAVQAGVIGQFGDFWMELSPTNTVGALVVALFTGADYVIPDRVEAIQKDYYPTVGEIADRVTRRFTGGTSIQFEEFEMVEYISDEVEQIIMEMGDEAWFLIIQEQLTIDYDDEGFATLPGKVERPLWIERIGDKRPQSWAYQYHDSAGNVVIRLNASQETSNIEFFTRYLQRWIRPQFLTDKIPIPKKHIETVVYAVCRTLAATRERSQALEATFERLYMSRLTMMKREQARFNRQARFRLRPRRRAMSEPFSHPNPKYRRF